MSSENGGYRIVSPELTVKAMRDSGYKNTAHALAELIDNSIDATASLVEVFACESPVQLRARTSHRVDKLAVLDNGHGMEADVLRRALKYGDGHSTSERRIGRFGMGLPNSSLSQCTKVEVWSWKNGPGNALYTYLDLKEIQTGLDDVPEPRLDPVPQYWRDLSEGLGPAGTLVLWTNLDRVDWHGASTTLKHTEEAIGRIYRNFLKSGEVRIRMAPVREGKVIEGEYYAAPNDPLYLTPDSCTPAPFSTEPMFTAWDLGDPERPGEYQVSIADENGTPHPVTVRASISRPEARRSDIAGHPWPENAIPGKKGGDQPWGKHAGRNLGVSLVRENRELILDSAWTIGYDPTERWWGIEVNFPRALDKTFGVTNSKQNATVFESLARFDWETEKEGDETFKAFKDRLAEFGDPRLPLIDLALYIKTQLLPPMRRALKQQTLGVRSGGTTRHPDPAPEKATKAIEKRRSSGHATENDRVSETQTDDEKRKEQMDNLTQRHNVDPKTANSIVEESLERGLLANWIESAEDTEAFFVIDPLKSILQVVFNTEHVLHERLMAVIGEVPEDIAVDELRDRLAKASTTFKLLLFSWARMEQEASADRDYLKALKAARRDWGRYATTFIEDEDF
ncbi:ATP-binding protein [Actinomadura sp. WAC 06369]|uniref:ATP-binding protein n=1 Tax=Actinomadura sp. WAC 06369 TaxID=2203193 RepID=UPI001F2B53A9|nr:ATP-binding protein [Actinomadura sp. WAC 06369]